MASAASLSKPKRPLSPAGVNGVMATRPGVNANQRMAPPQGRVNPLPTRVGGGLVGSGQVTGPNTKGGGINPLAGVRGPGSPMPTYGIDAKPGMTDVRPAPQMPNPEGIQSPLPPAMPPAPQSFNAAPGQTKIGGSDTIPQPPGLPPPGGAVGSQPGQAMLGQASMLGGSAPGQTPPIYAGGQMQGSGMNLPPDIQNRLMMLKSAQMAGGQPTTIGQVNMPGGGAAGSPGNPSIPSPWKGGTNVMAGENAANNYHGGGSAPPMGGPPGQPWTMNAAPGSTSIGGMSPNAGGGANGAGGGTMPGLGDYFRSQGGGGAFGNNNVTPPHGGWGGGFSY